MKARLRSLWAGARKHKPLALRHVSILLTILLVMLLEQLGLFQETQNRERDVFLRSEVGQFLGHTYIIGITENDYETFFDSGRPEAELVRILKIIKKGGAKVIGVDIETSSQDLWTPPIFDDPPGAPIVWSYGVSRCDTDPEKDFPQVPPHLNPHCMKRDAVLGGGGPPPTDNTGLALILAGPDGVVRDYRRSITMHPPETDDVTDENFATAIVRKFREEPNQFEPDRRKQWIRFRQKADMIPFRSAGDLLCADEAQLQDWLRTGPLLGKIVLVGGVYPASADRHRTPVGDMYGVQVLANIIETELSGQPPEETPVLAIFEEWGIAAIFGLLLPLALQIRLRSKLFRWSVGIGLWLVLVLAMAAFNYFYFRTVLFWACNVMIVIGLSIEQLSHLTPHPSHPSPHSR